MNLIKTLRDQNESIYNIKGSHQLLLTVTMNVVNVLIDGFDGGI